MYMLMVAVGVLVVGFILYIALKEMGALTGSRTKPEASTGYKPSVKPAAHHSKQAFQTSFKGQGMFATEPVFLECAVYRVQYQFPQDSKVKLEIVSADGTNRKTIAHKAGYGSATFNIMTSKYHIFHITPDHHEANWSLVVNAL